MSRFFSDKHSALVPYVPGEQPRDMQYIKLNTNESPFPPSPTVGEILSGEWEKLRLYSDPECTELRNELASLYGIKPEQILFTNGSDEALYFAFMAFADEKHPLVFPNITYGFYPVYAELNHIPYQEIPLRDDFTVNADDYIACGKNVVIANPNAPTGIGMSLDDISRIVGSNPDNVVVIDEAYVDFGGKSAVCLINEFDNLLVIQTFSKSRSMAGGRLGFAIGNASLISDLNTLKYSTNPYNINRLTSAAGVATLRDNDYYMANCRTIMANREKTTAELRDLGFEVLDSCANFVFARSKNIGGRELYLELKRRGILVRQFEKSGINDFIRITIGKEEQMTAFINTVKEILKNENCRN